MQAEEFHDLYHGWGKKREIVRGESISPSVLVMVQNRDNGEMFTIKDVEFETHEDGSRTIWIKVEDY